MMKYFLISLLLSISTVTLASENSASEFQAGIHYKVLSPGIDVKDEQPVLYEFFGYTCPGCNAMQPVIHELEQSTTFKLVRVPVVFHATWEPYAITYHTLELMGLTENTHQAIFYAIHTNKKVMRNTEQIADWLASSFAIDKKEFLDISQSFAVDSKMRQAEKLRQSLNITNTPTLIINGKYKPENTKLGTKSNIIKLSKELLSQ